MVMLCLVMSRHLGESRLKKKQAGAELGQAQLELDLGYTLIKACCIILIITNYHYISLSTIGLSFVTSTYLHTSLLNCYLPCLLAYLL